MDNKNDKLIKAINDWKSTDRATIKIHGKKYSLVSTRLAVARRNLGSSLDLKSTLIFHDEKKVIVQVDAYIDEKHCASGLAEEYRTANFINKTSALEVAETSAAGRALAFLSLCDNDIASAEEVSKAVSNNDAELTKALTELDRISHIGNFQAWITKHSDLFKRVKSNNPLAYQSFMEQFSKIRTTLESKGVIKNGRSTTS